MFRWRRSSSWRHPQSLVSSVSAPTHPLRSTLSSPTLQLTNPYPRNAPSPTVLTSPQWAATNLWFHWLPALDTSGEAHQYLSLIHQRIGWRSLLMCLWLMAKAAGVAPHFLNQAQWLSETLALRKKKNHYPSDQCQQFSSRGRFPDFSVNGLAQVLSSPLSFESRGDWIGLGTRPLCYEW